MRICLLAILALPCAVALRCYEYMDTNDDLNPEKKWVDCNDSQFCFKNYAEQHETLNDKKWRAIRNCGSPSVCKTEGCTGTRDSWSCCCRGELCNATSSPKALLLILFSALYMVLLYDTYPIYAP